jgi:hypothetical protein
LGCIKGEDFFELLNDQLLVIQGLRSMKLGKGKEHHAMKAYWGVEAQLHSFSDIGTGWR